MRVCTVIVHARPLVLGVAHALRTPLKLLQLRAHSTDLATTVAFRTARPRSPSRGRKQVSEIEKAGSTDADGMEETAKVLPGDGRDTPNAVCQSVRFLCHRILSTVDDRRFGSVCLVCNYNPRE